MTNETELMPDVIWVGSVRKVKNAAGETINLLACDDDKRDPANKNSPEYIRADAQRVPEGFALVPLEPTEEMIKAAKSIRGGSCPYTGPYKAMIAAAQKLNGE